MAPEPPAPSVAASPPVLRPIRESDVAPIARWYAKATVVAGSPSPLSDLLDSSGRLLVLTEGDSHQPVGLVLATLDDPEPGWATVSLLAIAGTEQRDVAAQAVALLEANLNRVASHIRAAVPSDVGLALYFWLRQGYRPNVSAERLWMTRDFDT